MLFLKQKQLTPILIIIIIIIVSSSSNSSSKPMYQMSRDTAHARHPVKTNPRRLIRVFAVRIKTLWILGYPQSVLRRLIRLHACADCTHMQFCTKCCVPSQILGGNCGSGVRTTISKLTPFIYLAFEKNEPIHILDILNC